MKHNKKEHSRDAEPDAAPAAATPAPEATAAAPAASPAAAPAAATPAPSPLETELVAVKDKHVRLMADFDNFRKRQLRDRDDSTRRATEALVGELLPVLDHLDLALATVAAKDDPFVKGVRLVSDQLLAALAKFDVRPFQAVGQPFDPNRHEALTQQPSAAVPANHVLQQLRCGYLLGSRLLRPAQVIISTGRPQTAADASRTAVAPAATPPTPPLPAGAANDAQPQSDPA